ncbi:MAG: fused MFS/spermidine synthase [Planctomycetes bacterium]|nr:fused MFS/spermidine synthase [Planctomycetota bacterium]MBI3845776.1 fused MFS/spermidine synthase [Planctomycetota bacterium]
MGRRFALFATVFVTGACALGLELLSARVLAPVFGNALHVWAALITVTLGFLAIGYALGGVAADRAAQSMLGLALVGAAISTIVLTWLRAPVLAFSMGVGFEIGALLAATILFALPMTFLGMMGPIAVRLDTSDVARAGRTAGMLFCVSTIGSVAGALVTGFVLAPAFRVSTLLFAIAAVLGALAVPWLAFSRRRAGALLAAVVGLGAGALGVRSNAPTVWETTKLDTWTADGETKSENVRYVLRWSGPSRYGDVKVVDTHGDKLSNRILFLDGTPQTIIQIDDAGKPLYSVMDYTYGLQLAQLMRPEAQRAMVIGVGGAGLCHILDEKGLTVDLSEIDPEVARLAKEYFGLRSTLPVSTLDGAEALRRATGPYDLVFVDAYHANDIPVHLVLPEFFAAVAAKLDRRGIVALNCMTATGEAGERVWRAVARSVSSAFRFVRVYAQPGGDTTNYLLFGSSESLPSVEACLARRRAHDPEMARTRMPDAQWDAYLDKVVGEMHEVEFDGTGPELSADWNPLPEWQIPASLAIRRSVIATFPTALLTQP